MTRWVFVLAAALSLAGLPPARALADPRCTIRAVQDVVNRRLRRGSAVPALTPAQLEQPVAVGPGRLGDEPTPVAANTKNPEPPGTSRGSRGSVGAQNTSLTGATDPVPVATPAPRPQDVLPIRRGGPGLFTAEPTALGYVVAPTPNGRTARAARTRVAAGSTAAREVSNADALFNEIGRFDESVENYPTGGVLERYEFGTAGTGEAAGYRIPTVERMNALADEAARANPATAPSVRFVGVDGQIEVRDYLRRWGNEGLVPVDRGAARFFHDMMNHAPQFLALPAEVVERSRAKARYLLRARDLSPNREWRALIDSLIADEVRNMDRFTGVDLPNGLNTPGPQGRAIARAALRDGVDTSSISSAVTAFITDPARRTSRVPEIESLLRAVEADLNRPNGLLNLPSLEGDLDALTDRFFTNFGPRQAAR